jgi:copper chaperone CopZ
MIRRQFIKLATLTGATGLASLGAVEALRSESSSATTPGSNDARSVTWHVRGFTCVTCAVGLETLLRREKGVISADATYPEAMVTIQFHPDLVDEKTLRAAITELGFTAEEKTA